MSRFPEAGLALGVALIASTAFAGPFDLGREATPDEVAAWDIDVRPDGQGLPEGRGTVEDGEQIFADNCASCHGDFGEGVDRWPVLAGGDGSLTNEFPVKTIGSFWPYASTIYDYVHRAMPFGDAQSLTPDETYALVAYILNLNYVVEDDFELSNENFAEVRMPNEDGFFMDDRIETEHAPRSICMQNCKDDVAITKRAMVLDVTPDHDGEGLSGVD
jgi:cytochrome c